MTVPKHLEGTVRKIFSSGLSWLNARAMAEEQGETEAARDWLKLNLTGANGEQILDGAKEKAQTFSRQQALEDVARCQEASKEVQPGYFDLPGLS